MSLYLNSATLSCIKERETTRSVAWESYLQYLRCPNRTSEGSLSQKGSVDSETGTEAGSGGIQNDEPFLRRGLAIMTTLLVRVKIAEKVSQPETKCIQQ